MLSVLSVVKRIVRARLAKPGSPPASTQAMGGPPQTLSGARRSSTHSSAACPHPRPRGAPDQKASYIRASSSGSPTARENWKTADPVVQIGGAVVTVNHGHRLPGWRGDHIDARIGAGQRAIQRRHQKIDVPADILPVRADTLSVATMPVPASPSGGQNSAPGSRWPVGSSRPAPSGSGGRPPARQAKFGAARRPAAKHMLILHQVTRLAACPGRTALSHNRWGTCPMRPPPPAPCGRSAASAHTPQAW